MKFGKAAQLILAIGIFAVGGIFLNRLNTQRQAEQEQINIQLSAAQLLMPKMIDDKNELEAQLAQMQAELESVEIMASASKANFLIPVESIEYDELIFSLAHDRDLEVAVLTATEPSTLNVDDISFTLSSFIVQVRGVVGDTQFATPDYRTFTYQTVADILDFISAIANGDEFRTATIETVDIQIPEFLTEEDIAEIQASEESVEYETATAVIRINIYSYEGY